MSQIVRQPLIKPTSGKEDKKKKRLRLFDSLGYLKYVRYSRSSGVKVLQFRSLLSVYKADLHLVLSHSHSVKSSASKQTARKQTKPPRCFHIMCGAEIRNHTGTMSVSNSISCERFIPNINLFLE